MSELPIWGFLDADGQLVLDLNPYVVEGTYPPGNPQPAAPTPAPSAHQLGYLAPPTPTELARFLMWPEFDVEQQASAQSHLDRAARLCKAYTRGRGWIEDWMAPALREVVLSVAGRTLANPTSATRISAGAYSETPGPDGWLLHERLLLNDWRRRAA